MSNIKINTQSGIQMIKTTPIGVNSFEPNPHVNIDAYYGPYDSENDALTEIPNNFRAVGLTVGIYTDNTNKIKEKWFLKNSNNEWILVDKVADDYYGPYDNVLDALNKIPEDLRKLGLTVGIYTDESKTNVKEMWFLGDPLELVDKIAEYELILDKFEAYPDEANNKINIIYQISGKGLLPKVTISGTNVVSRPVNFGTESYAEVSVSTPGTYSFSISVSDVLGTKFNTNDKETTILVYYGTIIAGCTNTSYISKLPPLLSAYENVPIGIYVNYNLDKIENIKIYLNDYEFTYNEISAGRISSTLILPDSKSLGFNPYIQGENVIKVLYNNKGESETLEYPIYRFNILLLNHFALTFPNGMPDYGYSGTGLNFNVNVNYGGGESVSKLIMVTLNGQNPLLINVPLNSNINVTYKLPVVTNFTLTDSKGDFIESNIKIEILGENLLGTKLSETKTIKIYKIVSPTVPSGDVYFNSNYNNIIPQTNSQFSRIIPNNANEMLLWSSEHEEVVVTNILGSFNLDFCIRTSLNGENTPLITIKKGSDNLLIIGKLKISSPLLFEAYQENNLTLPTDSSLVHIGFGYLRKFVYTNSSNTKSCKFYNCIFINGEIAFSSEVSSYNNDSCSIVFNDIFNLSEFSFHGSNEMEDISNPYVSSCINLGRDLLSDYVLGNGLYDVFYYDWLTTLSPEDLPKTETNLIELLLVPFLDSGTQSEWWERLRTDINELGKPIKDLTRFILFGNINRGGKPGLGDDLNPNAKLFDFIKSDKEEKKLDKIYAVICKYRFYKNGNIINNLNFSNVRFCIVQVQGTSTLAYPEPNLQFTFIKYENGRFTLDNSVTLTYLTPEITKISDSDITLTFTEKTVEGETNLVAKADSMDSSHLNNTPTCIYLNALLDSLKNDNVISTKFNDTLLDAIVGCPILIKIDSRDGMDNGVMLDYDINTSDDINYNSFGTFMFNTGKSANNMGLNNPEIPVFSLEGQSNENTEKYGAPGIFTLPDENYFENNNEEEIDTDLYRAAFYSFLKVRVVCSGEGSERKVEIEELDGFNNLDKKNIMNYLINSSAFESRSIIDDKYMTKPTESNPINSTMENLSNKTNWDLYGKHVLRMWLFVNQVGSSDLANFAKYFDVVFNLDYSIIYYIHLLLFGLADNLGKNMMIDCEWKEDYTKEIWYIREYDLDSENGLTNNGFDNFPVYGCISQEHFIERFIGLPNHSSEYTGIVPTNTFNRYNSSKSILWSAFWKSFKKSIESKYKLIRDYVTPERIINIGKTIVSDHITKEQYNIDFSLKHLGTEFIYLNKGGRFLNYQDWITKRFMYVDSYFSYFKFQSDLTPVNFDGYTWKIGKTLVPIFYEAAYQSPETRYGITDFVYEKPLNGNMQYVLNIVPEAVISMSPIMDNRLLSAFNAGKFTNVQNYVGGYIESVFSVDNSFKNLLSVEIREINKKETTKDLYILDSLNKLELDNLNITNNFHFGQNSNIEKIILKNCDIQNLALENLALLKQLTISNCNILNLTLQNLKLDILEIDINSEINVLSIMGQTTSNNELDFSGCKINNINFTNNPTVEKLYLNWIYDLNGIICSVYDFGEGKKITIGDENGNHTLYSRTNMYISSENGLEPIYLNSKNFPEKNKIQPSVEYLDLHDCKKLKYLSCIGSKLKTLTLPYEVVNDSPVLEVLNLLFCRNLINLSSNDQAGTLNPEANTVNGFNFINYTNLKCDDFYLVERKHVGLDISNGRPYAYGYYIAHKITNKSFNLMGCEAVKTITNLNLNPNQNSSFTGAYLFSGCTELLRFNNCSFTFKNLTSAFKHTLKLRDLPTINIYSTSINNIDISYAFSCCGIRAVDDNGNNIADDSKISITKILNNVNLSGLKLIDMTLENTTSAFSGISFRSSDRLGSSDNTLSIKWKYIGNTFGYPSWSYTKGFIDFINDPARGIKENPDKEYFYSNASTYYDIETPFAELNKNSEPVDIYVKFPNALNAYACFINTNVCIKTTEPIFSNNITEARSFLAGTKLNTILNLTNCTNGSSYLQLGFFYEGSEITSASFTNSNNPCLLPKNTSNRISVQSMFRGCDLTGLDVKGIFDNINIERANGCFGNTNCSCSGNPFHDENTSGTWNDNIDISAMFGITNPSKFKNHNNSGNGSSIKFDSNGIAYITDISWITSHMITSNRGYSNRLNNGSYLNLYGVFEGRPIENFIDIPPYNVDDLISPLKLISVIDGPDDLVTSLIRMFRNTTIYSYGGEKIFTITGLDSTSIFEGTNFNLDNNNKINIIIDSKVRVLDSAFKSSKNCFATIEIKNNNSILNINSMFYLSSGGGISFDKKESIDEQDPIYFSNLRTAIRAFSNTNSINNDTFSYKETQDSEYQDINLFRGCNNLKNIDKIFLYSNVTKKFNFVNCANLETMNYAFYNSSIQELPSLPETLPNLTSAKGAFRRIMLGDNNTNIYINSVNLTDITELFAESKFNTTISSDKKLGVYVTSNNLKDASASSTNSQFNINITSTSEKISVSQPSQITEVGDTRVKTDYIGGTLSISNIAAEELRYLAINNINETDLNNKWTQIVSEKRTKINASPIYTLLLPKNNSDNSAPDIYISL